MIQQRSSNWTPGRSDNSGYKHHDIIAHRVVDKFPKKTNNSHSPVNASYKDKDRIEVLKTKRELRDLKEQIARQDRSVQFGEREEQPRYVTVHRRVVIQFMVNKIEMCLVSARTVLFKLSY